MKMGSFEGPFSRTNGVGRWVSSEDLDEWLRAEGCTSLTVHIVEYANLFIISNHILFTRSTVLERSN